MARKRATRLLWGIMISWYLINFLATVWPELYDLVPIVPYSLLVLVRSFSRTPPAMKHLATAQTVVYIALAYISTSTKKETLARICFIALLAVHVVDFICLLLVVVAPQLCAGPIVKTTVQPFAMVIAMVADYFAAYVLGTALWGKKEEPASNTGED